MWEKKCKLERIKSRGNIGEKQNIRPDLNKTVKVKYMK